MNDRMANDQDICILEKLYENDINYFSFTLFKNFKPIISHCNHAEWLRFYNEQYGIQQPPPVQKYIFRSALGLLTWDFNEIDKDSKAFVQKRNNVVEARENITMLFKRQDYLTAITLGTQKKRSHLVNFLNSDLQCLLLIERNLLYKAF